MFALWCRPRNAATGNGMRSLRSSPGSRRVRHRFCCERLMAKAARIDRLRLAIGKPASWQAARCPTWLRSGVPSGDPWSGWISRSDWGGDHLADAHGGAAPGLPSGSASMTAIRRHLPPERATPPDLDQVFGARRPARLPAAGSAAARVRHLDQRLMRLSSPARDGISSFSIPSWVARWAKSCPEMDAHGGGNAREG